MRGKRDRLGSPRFSPTYHRVSPTYRPRPWPTFLVSPMCKPLHSPPPFGADLPDNPRLEASRFMPSCCLQWRPLCSERACSTDSSSTTTLRWHLLNSDRTQPGYVSHYFKQFVRTTLKRCSFCCSKRKRCIDKEFPAETAVRSRGVQSTRIVSPTWMGYPTRQCVEMSLVFRGIVSNIYSS